MKKIMSFVLGILLATALAVYAGNKLPYDGSKPAVPIQNAAGMAPAKAASGCVTQSITKGTFGKYTSLRGYMQYEAEVVTASGAAESVKWEMDGTQVATGASFKMVNEGGTTYSRAIQRVYSAGSRVLTFCVRRR